MAGGAFQTSRELFNNPIWQNILEFRLFFLIYGNAIFSDEGHRVDDTLTLQRGQWLRSTRKLQEDLQYIESRAVKQYSTATINRAIKRLVTLQRVCTKTHELGTVFTVLNYEQYQGFEGYSKEPSETGSETATKQKRNNNKNVEERKESKDIKHIEFFEKYTSNSELIKALMDFVEMRKEIKSPVSTERMINILLSNLDKLSSDDKTKIDILDQAIFHKWKTVYALKDDFNSQQRYQKPLSKHEQNQLLLDQHGNNERVIVDGWGAGEAPIKSLFDSLPSNGD